MVASDEGAARLGEVALVPHSSPISQSGRLFYNTLFDENAASHVALGAAYRFTMKGAESMADEAFAAAGGNRSMIHVDFMIGNGSLDVDGVLADGTSEAVMRNGDWVRDGLLGRLGAETVRALHRGSTGPQLPSPEFLSPQSPAPAPAFIQLTVSFSSTIDLWLFAPGPLVRGSQILRRPADRLLQLARGAQRPVRIAQQLTRQQHAVGLSAETMASACDDVVMSPTAPVGIFASRRIRSANGTW